MMVAVLSAKAGDGDKFINANVGFLMPKTLNASIGWERELANGHAFELFAEAGNHWQRNPETGRVDNENFWKGYYWDGGLLYKHRLAKYKNSALRFRLGPVFGAVQTEYFFGAEAGFEYDIFFRSGVQLSLIQKNNVGFMHGDTFRNGIMIGLRVPLN
jgi:hypothetical protein